jgi:NADH-quinone oxidoreductase subunit N
MIDTPTIDWWSIAPELVTGVASIVVLLIGMGRGRLARGLVPGVSALALLVSIALVVGRFGDFSTNAFSGQIDTDPLANLARILAAFAGLVAVAFSLWGRPDDGRTGEHHSLLLAAVCGMGLFAAAGSLVSLFVGLELFSIALYVLCALEAERVESLEAGLKYLIVGGLSSAVLLYGAALVYGATGTLDLADIGDAAHRGLLLHTGAALLIAALAFKASAAPMHWWTPDVYDGAPTSITAFMAAATKAAALLATARVLVTAFHPEAHSWQIVIAAIAAISIVVGNLGAIVQQRLKRMLAYSSIAHAGYLLIGLVGWKYLGVAALGYALIVYVTMTLGAFALVLVHERRVGGPVTYDDMAGSGWPGADADPNLAWLGALPGLAMTIVMLSLAGIPPTAGFFAKFGLFQGAVDAGYEWLAFVGVLGSAVSLVYYLRVLVVMYMRPRPAAANTDAAPARTRHVATIGVVLALGVLVLAIVPRAAFEPACDVRDSLVVTAGGELAACAARPTNS